MHKKDELTAKEFTEKLKSVKDRGELLDNFSRGRFELRIRGRNGRGVFLSPNILDMSEKDGQGFIDEILNIVSMRPRIRYVQW